MTLADKLLINGNIYTMDAERPRASKLALSGNRILAVGDGRAAIAPLLSPGAEVYDLGGRCIIPGMTDSHIHFMGYALSQRDLDLSVATSLTEAMAMVAKRARETPPGTWVLGRRWDQERWTERRFPTAADIDRAAPDHPVMLRAKNGHALAANSRALALADITVETPDPPGARIGRDEAGRPNGLLFEDNAMHLVEDIIPLPEPDEIDAAIQEAFPSAWRVGLTSIHDVDPAPAFAAYQRLRARSALGLRVVKYLPADDLDCALALNLQAGLGDDWLRVGGIKVFADGALGAHTAAMLAPYEGMDEDDLGVLTIEADALHELAQKAVAGNLPLAIHAIGDRANRMALDVLAEVGAVRLPGLPHRIEHVQILHPDDLKRLAALDVTASMQPIHATQDWEMAERYWGERCITAYAWRSLLETGALLAFGSDSPVEDLNPLLGVHAAVTRRRRDGAPGPEGWHSAQRLTVMEAVHAYTLGAARAVGLDEKLGSLKPGKLADLVVLDRDIFTAEPMAIAETTVTATMIDGQVVHGAF